MKLVIQRVSRATVTSDGVVTGDIGTGLVVLIGVTDGDTEKQAEYLAGKTARLRIFTDDDDKLNLSVTDVSGKVIVVSNFTLAGDCKKGNRPSFDKAAKQPVSEDLYLKYVEYLKALGVEVYTGIFGAHMEIDMNAYGPITIVMDSTEMGH